MILVVLAAGLGSRFGGLKQIEKIDEAGNFLIDYSVNDAVEAGFNKVIFVIKKAFAEEFKNSIGQRASKICQVFYAYQELDELPAGFKCPEGREKPWGTVQTLLVCKDLIDEPFITINADDYYGKETFKVAYEFLAKLPKDAKKQYANVCFEVANTMPSHGAVKRGVCFHDESNYLTSLVESSVERGSDGVILATPLNEEEVPFKVQDDCPVSMNLFCFTKEVLDELSVRFVNFLKVHGSELKSECLIPMELNNMIKEGYAKMTILRSPSVWYGITYKEDKETVVNALKNLTDQGLYKKGLY